MAHAQRGETMLLTPPRTCMVGEIGQCSKESQILEAMKIMSHKWLSRGGHSHLIWHILTNTFGTITMITSHEKLTRSKKKVKNGSRKRSLSARQIP
eukprot:7531367-Ditylum_brightwellii.AAC.1